MRFDDLHGLGREARRDLGMLEVRPDLAGAPEGTLDPVPAFLAADAVFGLHAFSRCHRRGAIFDVKIGRNIQRGGHAEIGIESAIDGAAGQGLAVIKDPGGFHGKAQVPFADHGSAVALLTQDAGKGEPSAGNDRTAPPVQLVAPGGKAPGQEGIARWHTGGAAGMRVGEDHSTGRHPVEVRGGDPAGWVVGLEVAVAHVIGENENDIGRLRRSLQSHRMCPTGDREYQQE